MTTTAPSNPDTVNSMSDPEEAALFVDGLTKTFGSGEDAITAVDDVSFSVEPGTIVGVLGPNGAGKTTTIKSILQLVKPDAGTVYFDGVDITEHPREVYNNLSMMLEGARNDYWRLTVRENLRYFSVLKGEDRTQTSHEHDRLLEHLDLAEKADEQVRDLSRGMKQKVSLASALAGDVSVTFLDEPTLGLDVESSLTLRQELTRIVEDRNLTVVLSSHDMDVIEDICDRVIIMNNGRIIADNDVEGLLDTFDTQGYRITLSNTGGHTFSSLSARYPIENVETFERRVRFDLTADNETFYELLDDVRASELVLDDVNTMQPNLEQAFLELTEEGEQ